MRYIRLENNVVKSVRWGKSIVEGEIQSDIGECGQIRQIDGSFITPAPPPLEPSESDYLVDLDYRLSKLELKL